jgi:hypothetical protein
METLYDVLLVLHLLGWAVVLGGAVASMRTPVVPRGMLHGILTALVTGIAMVGLASSGLAADEPDNVKIGIKLLVAVAVTVLVVLGGRRARVTTGYLGAIAGLTVVNVAIAVLWD